MHPARPKICLISATPLTIHFFMKPHLRALMKSFDVTLITNLKNDSYLPPLDVPVRQLNVGIQRKMSPLRDVVTLMELCRLFKREQFDLVVTLAPKAGLLGMLAALAVGIKKRLHIFQGEVWASRRGLIRLLLKNMDRITALVATHVLCVSESERQFLESEVLTWPGKIKVLAPGSISGVDTNRFRPDAAMRALIRQTCRIPSDAVLCLFMGRLSADKGIFELAQAFSQVARQNPDLWLLIVGPDEEDKAAELRAMLKGAVAERVVFETFTSRPEDYLAAADFLCLPSYREAFSIVVLEAAATGLPVIASRIYGIQDGIVENETGLFVPPRHVSDLAVALSKLTRNADMRHRMGLAARARVERDFQQQKIVGGYVHYIEALFT